MNGAYHCQCLRIRQPFAIWCTTALPRPIAADADIKDNTHFGQRIRIAVHIHPGVLHRTSFAKYAAAFFMISFSRFSRATSARSLDSSIISGVTTLLPAPLSFPSESAFIQLRSVWSPSPSSFTTTVIDSPSLTRLTASSLNSAV